MEALNMNDPYSVGKQIVKNYPKDTRNMLRNIAIGSGIGLGSGLIAPYLNSDIDLGTSLVVGPLLGAVGGTATGIIDEFLPGDLSATAIGGGLSGIALSKLLMLHNPNHIVKDLTGAGAGALTGYGLKKALGIQSTLPISMGSLSGMLISHFGN